VHFAQLRRLDASLLVGLYAKDLYAEKAILRTTRADACVYTSHHLDEGQSVCDRAAIDEVIAHGGTANGSIRSTAP
jgi:ABC-type Na+ transport system ATPase subunit NatA